MSFEKGIDCLYISGIIAFALLFVNDFNDLALHRKLLKICFPLGALLVVISSVLMIIQGNGFHLHNLPLRLVIGSIVAVLCWCEIYSLFFSFDKRSAYSERVENRKVYSLKFYALCRHPGVLFFIFMYFGLWLITSMPLPGMILLSSLNLFLVIFEDIVVFPSILQGYEEYKKETPFLVPTSSSIAECIKDFRSN